MADINTINESLDKLQAKYEEVEALKKSVEAQDRALNELVQKGIKISPNEATPEPSYLDKAFEQIEKTNFAKGEKAEFEVPLFKAATPGVLSTVNNPTVTDLGTAFTGAIPNGWQTALRIVSTPGLDVSHFNQYQLGSDLGTGAALTTENDLLPLVQAQYTELNQKAFVVGASAKISKYAQSSKPELANAVNILLGRATHKVIDAVLHGGHAPYSYAGIAATAKTWTSSYKTVLDAAADFVNTFLPVNGLAGTKVVAVVNPADLAALVNAVDSSKRYLAQPITEGYLTAPITTYNLRGIELRSSPSVKAGDTYFVLSDFAELHVADQAVVTVGQESDDLRRGQLTSVLSTRIAPVSLLDYAFIKVGLAA